jgi:hypothetical protein
MPPTGGRFLNIEGYRLILGGPINTRYVPNTGEYLDLIAGGTEFVHGNGAVAYGEPGSGVDVQAEQIRYGFLDAIELQTLSFAYLNQHFGSGFQYQIIHYNEVYRSHGDDPAPGMPVADVPVPVEGLAVYMHHFTSCLSTRFGTGFSVHPAGHWSYSSVNGALLPSGEFYDIVQPYKKPATTHKALFNQAFEQNRDYSFYNEDFPGKDVEDVGSFRTTGIWITF